MCVKVTVTVCLKVTVTVICWYAVVLCCSFCWGGLYAVLLTHGQTPAVPASVVYHGSLLTAADVEAINAPINFQQSDPAIDRQMNTTLYKQVSCRRC
jgi:dienelactone hydrolase